MDSRLHDSLFMGIRILGTGKKGEERNIRLFFVSDKGDSFQITLHNTQMLKCDNFRQGNIVFDLSELNPDKVSRIDIERLICHDDIEHVRNLNEERLTKDTERISEIIRSGEMKFIKMGSSYGAVLLALCERAAVEPLS